MNEEITMVPGCDGLPLHTYVWSGSDAASSGSPKAVIFLIHGQNERAGRYRRFAEALVNAGYAVVASDLRGHGKTVAGQSPDTQWGIPGHMADDDGWNKAVRDLELVTQEARKRFPGAPLYLFGHSMGSILAQTLIMKRDDLFDCMMLAGCWGGRTPDRVILRLLIWLQYFVLGGRSPGAWIDALTFDVFLKPFEPIRTAADWLTRDPDEADKFVDDPLVGQSSSCRHWIDFANAYAYVDNVGSIRRIAQDVPVSFWAGGQDPVSNFGKGFEALKRNYASAGLTPDAYFFEQCRHELLNELERDDITAQMIAWFDGVSSRS